MREIQSDSILKVKNLYKSFNGVEAVADLSFEVLKGEIFGFLGPNGAGKTTTINMICGLLKADKGDIIINGLSIKNNPKAARAMIGMCPQNIVIWKDLTCIEQIEFMASMYDIPVAEGRKRGLELLESLGLTDKKNKRGRTLSGGMQRRLNIILALIHDPDIIILDEPEAGLDPQSRLLVREYIKSLSINKTVILTSHNMDEVERLSNRIGIIDGGKLLTVGSSEKLKRFSGDEDILEITVGELLKKHVESLKNQLESKKLKIEFKEGSFTIRDKDVHNMLGDVINLFSSEGLSIKDIRIRKKNLEDVFISLTGKGLRE